MLVDILLATWFVVKASAAWLLIGIVIAIALQKIIPANFVEKHLRGKGHIQILKASLLGLPLPLCSCGVIPVAKLLREGAGKPATASFLVSTPEIGTESFLLSYGLLGPFFAIARVIASFFAAIFAGLAVGNDEQKKTTEVSDRSLNEQGIFKLIDEISVTLVIGFLLAGVAAVAIPDNIWQSFSNSVLLSYATMLIAALPLYVCATSSTPLAAVFLAQGVSPGAVLVFLLAGPATNTTTMTFVFREMGKRALTGYLLAIIGSSLIAGVIFELIVGDNFSLQAKEHIHGEQGSTIAAALLLTLLLYSLYRKSRPKESCCCH